MDHHAAVIQQLPGVAPVALTAQQLLAQILQGVLGVVAEGLDVGIGGTGADQEVIRKAADLVDLQQFNIHALLLIQGLGYGICDFFGR